MNKPDLSSFPTTPGIYFYKDATNHIIYIGKAKNLRKRLASYFNKDVSTLSPKTVSMLAKADHIDTLSTTTEKEALLLEASLIKKHRPKYNIVLKDDKQYTLFKIQRKHQWPRLEITRTVRKDGALYFGPFTSGYAAKATWKALHRAFPLRRCTDRAMRNRVRPCLYYFIKQCLAPCVYDVDKAFYNRQVRQVEQVLAGKSQGLLKNLATQMEDAAEKQEFEQAAEIRDQIKAITETLEKQAAVLSGGDMDVIGITETKQGLGLGILFVRGGMLIDGQTFTWEGLSFADSPELLLTFPMQFYSQNSAVPPRILLPWLPQDSFASLPALSLAPSDTEESNVKESSNETTYSENTTESESAEKALTLKEIEELLTEQRGFAVRIVAPQHDEDHKLIDIAIANARVALTKKAETPVANILAELFKHHKPLERIEAVDISHTSGVATRAGMVVFENGMPSKNQYRNYALEGTNGDDYAALALFAKRRVESGPPWPDLLLVDGGKGQISAVQRALDDAYPDRTFIIAGIAKARTEDGKQDRRAGNMADRIFIPNRSNPLPFRPGSQELLYLQRIRDAVHDFSIGRHRSARSALALQSELQRIKGVGPLLAQKLWENFSTLDDLRHATVEQLARIPGISKKKAPLLQELLAKL